MTKLEQLYSERSKLNVDDINLAVKLASDTPVKVGEIDNIDFDLLIELKKMVLHKRIDFWAKDNIVKTSKQ